MLIHDHHIATDLDRTLLAHQYAQGATPDNVDQEVMGMVLALHKLALTINHGPVTAIEGHIPSGVALIKHQLSLTD
jgi:hypothetical protein